MVLDDLETTEQGILSLALPKSEEAGPAYTETYVAGLLVIIGFDRILTKPVRGLLGAEPCPEVEKQPGLMDLAREEKSRP